MEDKIICKLRDAGFDIFYVGGFVRDSLLSIKNSDIDLVTNALPTEIEELFNCDDWKVDLAGSAFLICLVNGVEVASYREDYNIADGASSCRPFYAETLESDLARRDLTINSMALCPYTGDIIDPFGGQKDLKDKRIRFIGDPQERIQEDYVRMIRACRFASLINGTMHAPTFEAIEKNAHLVKEIAPERIRAEILKAMKTPKPNVFFNFLHSTGILKHILPELEACYNHPGGKWHNETVWDHSMLVGDALGRKDPLLRLVGFLHDIGKPATWDGERFLFHEVRGRDMIVDIFKRLKFSTVETKFAAPLVRHHMRMLDANMSAKALRKNLRKFEEDKVDWKDFLRLRIADTNGNLGQDNYKIHEIATFIRMFDKALSPEAKPAFGRHALAINGKDVMNHLEIRPGAIIGCYLDILLEEVLEDPEVNIRETLLSTLEEI